MSPRAAHSGSAILARRAFGRVSAVAVLITALSLGVHAREIHVDPSTEVAVPDGSSLAPFRRLTAAAATLQPDQDTTIILAPGRYNRLGGEVFPIEIAPGRGSVIVRGTGAPVCSLEGDDAPSILWIRSTVAPARAARFELRDVTLRGAPSGLSVVGGESQDLTVVVRDCVFSGFKVQGIEVVAGPSGRAEVLVDGCAFTGGTLYSLDLGTRWGSELVVEVRGNRFEGVPLATGGPFRNGAAIFADERAQVHGTVAANVFADTGNGLLITTAEPWQEAATVSLDIVGNAFVGDPDPSLNGLVHGAYLALHEQHSVSLRWDQNTVVAGGGHALFFEQSLYDPSTPDWQGRVSCDLFSLEAAGNVLVGFVGGVVNLIEPFPECVTFRDNAVDGTTIREGGIAATDGNFLVDAGDLDSAAGYRPTATGRLIDRVVVSAPGSPDRVDLDGLCRETDGDDDGVFAADVGAYELPGLCVDAALVFIRGDCAEDGAVDVTDPIHALRFLFLGDVALTCRDACDSNDNGELDVSDAVYSLWFLFVSGKPPPAPFRGAGLDPTADGLRPICVE